MNFRIIYFFIAAFVITSSATLAANIEGNFKFKDLRESAILVSVLPDGNYKAEISFKGISVFPPVVNQCLNRQRAEHILLRYLAERFNVGTNLEVMCSYSIMKEQENANSRYAVNFSLNKDIRLVQLKSKPDEKRSDFLLWNDPSKEYISLLTEFNSNKLSALAKYKRNSNKLTDGIAEAEESSEAIVKSLLGNVESNPALTWGDRQLIENDINRIHDDFINALKNLEENNK